MILSISLYDFIYIMILILLVFFFCILSQVTHVWHNATRNEHPGLRPDGCFYTGKVSGDPVSSVAVSLCHGMVSKLINNYILSTLLNYYITEIA